VDRQKQLQMTAAHAQKNSALPKSCGKLTERIENCKYFSCRLGRAVTLYCHTPHMVLVPAVCPHRLIAGDEDRKMNHREITQV
jgi:Zn-finger protein